MRFEQVVFDPGLLSAALATGLRLALLGNEALALAQMSQRGGRCIFAFTWRELNVFGEYTVVADQIRAVYEDSHKIAKRWFKRFHSEESLPDLSLLSSLRFIGSPPPKHLGVKKSTKRLLGARHFCGVRPRRQQLDAPQWLLHRLRDDDQHRGRALRVPTVPPD